MNDLKFALRQLLKNPGFTAVAVLTLALGIGANTAIFSLVDSVLLRPMPYPDPERLVRMASVNPELGVTDTRSSDPNIVDWQDRSAAFAEIAAFQEWDGAVTIDGVSESVRVNWVTPNLPAMLGIQPAHGRLLQKSDMDSGIMLPFSVWQRRFAGQSDVIGKPIKSDNEPASVVGILPPGASVPVQGTPAPDQAFVAADIRRTRFPRDLRLRNVVARLKPGVTVAQAQERMNRIAADLEKEHPDTNRGWGVKVTSLKTWETQTVRTPLLALYAATGILLLIACLNVSNLLLIRGESRRKETAIRAALGSSRLHLLRQSLLEGLFLAFAGAATGLIIAALCRDALLWFAPDSYGFQEGVGIQPAVFLWTLGIMVVAWIFSGLLPALRMSTGNLGQVLSEAGRSSSTGRERRRLLDGLVVSQIVISTILLAAAGLTLISFQKLMRVDPGFSRDRTVSFRVDPYPKADDTGKLLQAVSHVPGVESAGGANIELLHDLFSNGVRLTSDAGPEGGGANTLTADYWRVTTGYFRTVGIPLVSGRWFNDHDPFDVAGSHLVIVNEALARRFYPDEDAVGKTIRLLPREGRNFPLEIIGVVGSIKHHGLRENAVPILYAHAQDAPVLAVRTAKDPVVSLPAIREALHGVNPELIMTRVATTEQIVERSLAGNYFASLLLVGLAALGVVLAALGLYGVMSYAVGRRRREIGIRMAVGAQRREVTRMIVRQGMLLVAAGLGIGLVLAGSFGRAFRSLLFEVSPADPMVLAGIAALLGVVSLIACWLPARRAAKIDSMEALRNE